MRAGEAQLRRRADQRRQVGELRARAAHGELDRLVRAAYGDADGARRARASASDARASSAAPARRARASRRRARRAREARATARSARRRVADRAREHAAPASVERGELDQAPKPTRVLAGVDLHEDDLREVERDRAVLRLELVPAVAALLERLAQPAELRPRATRAASAWPWKPMLMRCLTSAISESSAGWTISVRTPPVEAGWTNATRELRMPIRGVSSIRRDAGRLQARRASASMSVVW